MDEKEKFGFRKEIIPMFSFARPIKIKIRREGEPKYVEVTGSAPSFSFFGDSIVKPHVLLESELDAMLLHQEVGDLCVPMALGGASKEADADSHSRLQRSPLILFALDFDLPGKKAYTYWKSLYSNLFVWPTPYAKSVGDAFQRGCDLRKWIATGIAHCDQRLQATI
jgi:DNA primase